MSRRPLKEVRTKGHARPERPARWIRSNQGRMQFINDDSDDGGFDVDNPPMPGPSGTQQSTEVAPEQQEGDGGSSGAGNVGASGDPIPLMHMQHERKESTVTWKAAGTSFINAANDGTSDNLWTNFPWEFPRFFVAPDQFMQVYNTNLYWKCEHVSITFKNPLCVQELGTGASGITQSGTNTQAQLFGYADVNYLTAINDKPGPHGNTTTGATFTNWMQSWRHHGYLNGAPQLLDKVDIPDKLFTSIDPDIKEIGMGPGKSMTFGWRIRNDYWRGTTEIANTGPITSEERMPRWDPYMGYVANWNHLATAPGGGQDIAFANGPQVLSRTGTPGESLHTVPIGSSGSDVSTFPTVISYACPEPMPKLWLQLQPQLSSLTAGTGNSICQLQWELSARLKVTGRVPRRNRITDWGDNTAAYKTEYGDGRLGRQTIPVFKPAMSTYNGTNQ